MATRRFGVSRGETLTQVTEAVGSATAADNVELTVDLATGMTRHEVLMAIQYFKEYILQAKWPPA
ncbi:MAG: hypothetical protein ACOY3L_14325 [Pseudomonadota bacterium]